MALKTLSAFPYYGGKARMSSLICDMLDYNNTKTYIEPFGGGARTLLNKPRHEKEMYNDVSAGLCAFMEIMSKPDTAEKLIEKLYETEYSQEEFNKALSIKNEEEDNLVDELKRRSVLFLKELIDKYENERLTELKRSIERKKFCCVDELCENIIDQNFLGVDERKKLEGLFSEYCYFKKMYDEIKDGEHTDIEEENFLEFKDYTIKKFIRANISEKSLIKEIEKMDELKFSDLATKERNIVIKKTHADILRKKTSNEQVDERTQDENLELAVATYVVFSQSRDGMGKAWSDSKFKSTDDYHKSIDRLYDVAERLNGVIVTQVDAEAFLFDYSNNLNNFNNFNHKDVMMYMDPSYLNPDNNKNLGESYKASYGLEEHEKLLKIIVDAKCKILISNYDLSIYNEYLTEAKGWKRYEVETKTSVGMKKDNKRIEVLWYNY